MKLLDGEGLKNTNLLCATKHSVVPRNAAGLHVRCWIYPHLQGGPPVLSDVSEALSAFEQGVALTRRCSEQLESSERRIEELIERGGEMLERPFEPEEG